MPSSNEANTKVFSLSYCTWCKKAKEHLKAMKMPYKSFEVDTLPIKTRDAFIKKLTRHTRKSTFPQIFVQGQFVGGYDDLVSRFPLRKVKRNVTKKRNVVYH